MKISNNRVVAVSFLTLAVFLLVFFFRTEISDFFKKKISNGDFDSLLSVIREQASLPGKLVAKVESSKAYLTRGGVFNFTNNERLKANLSVFSESSSLDKIAQLRLEDMFKNGYFEHISPKGESASTVAKDIGYEYLSIGENIALGNFENDETLVGAWMASPGHKANILNGRFSELGVAVGKGIYEGRSTWIGVQIFAKPLSFCPKIDDMLKNLIDLEENQIKAQQEKLSAIQTQLDSFRKEGRRSRDEYNRLVDEYNLIANEINSTIQKLKADISNYNSQVRAFNACTQE